MNTQSNPETPTVTFTYADDSDGDWSPWLVAAYDGNTADEAGIPESYHGDMERHVSPNTVTRTFTTTVDPSDSTEPDWDALSAETYAIFAFYTDYDDGLPYLVGAYCNVTHQEGGVPAAYVKTLQIAASNGPITEHVVILDGDVIRAAFKPTALVNKPAGKIS